MSVQTTQKNTTTTYRTVNVAAADGPGGAALVSPATALPYAVNGAYGSVRYLVPVQQQQQQQQFVVLQPQMQQVVQRPLVQQMVSPVYVHSVPHLSVAAHDSEAYLQHTRLESTSGKSSSMVSLVSSSIKSPEPSVEEEEEEEEEEEDEEAVEVEEVEIVNIVQSAVQPALQRSPRVEVRAENRAEPAKMDTRYFGELLADVYRKNLDIHSCISEHVSRIKGRKVLDLTDDSKGEKDDVEALLPKGATELTKQQIRYLLQTRLTADKSMRLLLSTFSSLREELLHMSEDLRRLEGEKESLERDLSFKADQARQYDALLEAVRENNRQLQVSLKETSASQRSLEDRLLSSSSNDSSREFKVKELEARLRALEKENELLRQKQAGQAGGAALHAKTEELSRQYNQQLTALREEKDLEIQRLRSQVTRIHTEVVTEKQSSSEKALQLKIAELLGLLEQRQSTISRQEEEIRKLMQDRNDSSKNVTKTIITKRYRNQYPILGLLSDDYQATSPIKEAKTIVIERTGEMIKQEIITTP